MSKRALQIDAATETILNRLAQERSADPEIIVARALRLYDELYGESALEELDRRGAEYERTGESYGQEEVEAWLKTWGTRNFRPFRRPQ
jgi:predicted transcriptional regulator